MKIIVNLLILLESLLFLAKMSVSTAYSIYACGMVLCTYTHILYMHIQYNYMCTSVCRCDTVHSFVNPARVVPLWQTPSAPSWWPWWMYWTLPRPGTCAASSPMNWRNQTCTWMTWSWPSSGTPGCWTSSAFEKRLDTAADAPTQPPPTTHASDGSTLQSYSY